MMTKDPVRRIDASSLVKLLDDNSSEIATNAGWLKQEIEFVQIFILLNLKVLAPKREKKKESILKPNTILQNEDSSEKAKTQVY